MKATRIPASDTKVCTKCSESKSLGEFNIAKSRRDGLNPWCRGCCRAYYLSSRERILKQHAEYRSVRMPELAEKQAEYRAANPGAFRQWRADNPHLVWAGVHRDRCKRLGIVAVIEPFTKADVIATYGDACAYCETGAFEHLDHFIPVSKGGPHTLANVRPSCAKCNKSKFDKMPEEWSA